MTRPDPARSVAVLIGTATHRAPELPPLAAVGNNLTELARVLSGPAVGLVTADGIAELLDAASPQEAATALLDRAEEAEDLLLVYFAGHGLLDENGDLHLALHGTDPRPERLGITALPFAMVNRAIRESPARTRVLILDCCFSGLAVAAMSSAEAESLVADSTRVEGTYTLTATAGNALALAPPGEYYTAFTGELIRLLRDTAATEDLTLAGAYRHLAAVLPAHGHPRPQQRNTNGAGDLVLRPGEPEAPAPEDAPVPAVIAAPEPPPDELRRPRNPLHPLHFRRQALRWLWCVLPLVAIWVLWAGLTMGEQSPRLWAAELVVLVVLFLAALGFMLRTGETDVATRFFWGVLGFGAVAFYVAPIVVPPFALLLISAVAWFYAVGGLARAYRRQVLRRFVIRLDRHGLRVTEGRDEYYLPWHRLERVWTERNRLCVSFRPGYPAIDEITYSSRLGGYVLADLRMFTVPADRIDLALAHFAGPAFRRAGR
ncbi:caspase family protein [Catenuloplanes japonicus]|uniref:caspase family protein n=1 Tax=Catenuloplanes japonicus TaxID=33876 RepID=UPI00068EBD33|nr:caspase family protein [Catenuloplanes japonicus]